MDGGSADHTLQSAKSSLRFLCGHIPVFSKYHKGVSSRSSGNEVRSMLG